MKITNCGALSQSNAIAFGQKLKIDKEKIKFDKFKVKMEHHIIFIKKKKLKS